MLYATIRPLRIPVDGPAHCWYLEITNDSWHPQHKHGERYTIFHRKSKAAVEKLAKQLQLTVIDEGKF